MGSLLRLTALVAMGLTAVSNGCGDPKSDGTLCARCSASDPQCNSTELLSEDASATFCGELRRDECPFCRRDTGDENGNGLRDDIICEVQLQCRQQLDSAKLRCYPLRFDGSVIFEYVCDGSKPR
jgi:hypothetical protein